MTAVYERVRVYGLSAATCECQFDPILNTHRSPLIRPEELRQGLCKAHQDSPVTPDQPAAASYSLDDHRIPVHSYERSTHRVEKIHICLWLFATHYKNLNHLLSGLYDAICKKKWAAGARLSVNANHPSLGDWYASTVDR